MFVIASIICLAISAGSWFYAGKSVSRDEEIERRRRKLVKQGKPLENYFGSVEITDEDKSYELIATLRHQTRWNRFGAIFAAVGLILQTIPQLFK